ncbi:adenylate/guanylate cyclase domain-containing protein [Ferrovibrio sp.]|uniref:adenylate/guanylate cyclase domain-containing protein n=1 Tax=Ferrovibrio sp. TaxID=1917215 RepID=UPI001B669618|nr:adenylate/guanylate cyclase domain-containing protein [Ferrovibrio sp.]MBP7065634.1 adenylate/guanylate cyclase domain-containing protein [Ferrovibrio sp.]
MSIWQRMHDKICGPGCKQLIDAEQRRLSAAFAAEEYEGLRLAIGLRFLAIAIVALLLTLEMGWPMAVNYYPWLLALVLSGYIQLLVRRPGVEQPWMHWLFPLLDMSMLGAAIVLPNPFDPNPLPPPMRLSFDTVIYFPLLLALAALGQSARTVFFTALSGMVVWTGATAYIAMQPGVQTYLMPGNVAQLSAMERFAILLDPWVLSYADMIRRVVMIGLIGGILVVAAVRARHLVARQIESERGRRNLARHFSPHIAEELARMDDPLGTVTQLEASVLFADLVGFTKMSEDMTPAQTIALLREVHRRLAHAVFEQQGTLDKYLGDGIMASFGTPRPGPRDASAALLAARAMQQAIEQLNRQRAPLRQPPLQLAIGLHFGPLTLGNIGDENRVEYALVGETVNVAHRLEQMTRSIGASLCLSEAFATKLKEETRGDLTPLRDLIEMRPQPIRGLRERMTIWILPREAAAPDVLAPETTGQPQPEIPPTIH